MAPINTTKLLVLAILGFVAVVLGTAVLTLQLQVTREKHRLGLLGKRNKGSSKPHANGSKKATSQRGASKHRPSTRPSPPTSKEDIYMDQSFPPPGGSSWKLVGQAHWMQAAAFLKEWDAMFWTESEEGTTSIPGKDGDEDSRVFLVPNAKEYSSAKRNVTASPRWALEQSANAGHPLAQLYLANAHASGIWPLMDHQDEVTDEELHVFDEWSPTAHGDHPQMTKAFILWQMAAIAGNVEAAMALAHRFSTGAPAGFKDDGDDETALAYCEEVLPYYEAAAHGIMDQLETSPNSRAKVMPPMDKHILAQVHMHGGTSSRLEFHNKPDESKEAIQFYHLKATTTPWSERFYGGNKDGSEDSADDEYKEPSIDVGAAYTLAQFYHLGIRGVTQNLTQALMYYEIAGVHGHWESAGEAGTFYLWGMGVPQNVDRALELFKIGAPLSLDGCRRRHEQALLKTKKDREDPYSLLFECDDTSLNGMGLLYLLGVPGEIEVDLRTAEQYFTLAKEMGNEDAAYNLAMMWLGWKTHYKNVDDLEDDGMSSFDHRDATQAFPDGDDKSKKGRTPVPRPNFALHNSKRSLTGKQFKGPQRTEILDAIKLLMSAANKGHIQAKHRLGMIYAEGIELESAAALKTDAVKPDCFKARGMFQWITENASPARSKRLRKAYKDYTAGDLESSVRNYLAAAEAGSRIGQVNAAFLLERGTCLGLSPADCAKASVRLWKAAAARGSMEACLRVGDFYFYGRLRGNTLPVGPFGWVQYLLYPEEHLPKLLNRWIEKGLKMAKRHLASGETRTVTRAEEQKTRRSSAEKLGPEQDLLAADLSMAAHYYTEAVEKHASSRANFNLGFMHEWGLGLKQDFPLAKRHYDLANTNNKEAEVAVQIALTAMSTHEYLVKWSVIWDDWWNKNQPSSPSQADGVTTPRPSDKNPKGSGAVPRSVKSRAQAKRVRDIFFKHLFDASSLVIGVLLFILLQLRRFRQRQRRR